MIFYGTAPGFDNRRPAPRRRFAPVGTRRFYGAPDACATQIAQLQAQLAAANARAAALGPIIAQLKAIVMQGQAQTQGPVPASQAVVDVSNGSIDYDPNGGRGRQQVANNDESVERAWYGGEDFGDIDADLGLTDG